MIKELILTNYDRFFLNNIESIEFRPKQKLQLLLGTNGSGKSSLLSELNPLPINKNDFTNGSKEITIEKDNNIFKLKSTSNKNSFMLNNTELNDGGTKTVQLNLVKEYFNLTPKYNNIILGTEKLTAMSTNERKNILREMSTVDYSYGIYLYNTLKQELRDTVGYLKLMQIEMNNDISNIVNDDEILILKNDITKCKNMIDSLSMSYSKSEEYKDIPIIDLNIDMDILDKNKLQADLDYNNKFIINIEEEITNLNKEIDSLDDYSTTIKDSETLNTKLKSLEEYFKNINNKYNMEKYSPIDSKNRLDKLLNSNLNNINIELSYLDNIIFTPTEHKELKSKLEVLNNNLKIVSHGYDNNSKELEILLSNKTDNNKITCSSCGTMNYFGYSKEKEDILQEKVNNFKIKYDELNSQYLELYEVYQKQKQKITYLQEIKEIISDLSVIPLYTDLVKKYVNDITSITSTMLNIIFKNIEDFLLDIKDYDSNNNELIEVKLKISSGIEILNIYKRKYIEDKDKLINKLNVLLDKKREVNSNIVIIKNNIEKCNIVNKHIETLNTIITNYKFNKKQIVINNKNTILTNTIRELKSLLITLEDKYNNIEKIKSRIEINKKHIDSHEDIRVALQYAINALSPTEGIIAKSINSFINVFLNEMNTIINSVWSYELTLLPCQINESNDLDYLFAVKVADNKKDIKDVAYLSTSMKDIVDLSFKIVFMKYMKLTHMPLMLDEFGVFMDDTHRNKVYDVIENLLSNNFSQIYFTANFKSIYGRFVDSDINILDDKNLELDDIFYNENLKIVKK